MAFMGSVSWAIRDFPEDSRFRVVEMILFFEKAIFFPESVKIKGIALLKRMNTGLFLRPDILTQNLQ